MGRLRRALLLLVVFFVTLFITGLITSRILLRVDERVLSDMADFFGVQGIEEYTDFIIEIELLSGIVCACAALVVVMIVLYHRLKLSE